MKFFIPVVLLAAVLCSCGKSKTGMVTSTTPIFGSENSSDTIHLVPTGTILEYSGEYSRSAARSKIKFNGAEGFIENEHFILDGKGAVDSSGVFVVYDIVENGRTNVYHYDFTHSSLVDVSTLDTDTTNVTVAALADAIENGPYNDELNISLARIAAAHSTHPGLQVVKVDLSEVPDESILQMQKRFHLLIDKSKNEIITTKNTTTSWINSYTNDIFKIPGDGGDPEFNNPRHNYFYNYISALPSFVNILPKPAGAPEDIDRLKVFLLFRMDRRPENIKTLYDLYKPVIVNQFTSGFLQDVRSDINNLIAAYDRIIAMPNHKALMNDISKKIAKWDKENVDDKGFATSMYALADQASIYEPIIDTEKYDPASDFQGIWYSSFWTRRFAEGNEKVVYEILKDLAGVLPEEFDADGSENPNDDDESNETEVITCTFKDYSLGDCGHMLFDCGDYGDADTESLTKEEQQLWDDLAVEDENQDPKGNPKYVGKKFSIRIGTTRGPACNEGQGGEGVVPKILEFKLLD